MLASMCEEPDTLPETVRLLYSTRLAEGEDLSQILFLPRLRRLFAQLSKGPGERLMDLYLTETKAKVGAELGAGARLVHRRFQQHDLVDALGPVERRAGTVAYVCGPARMTDEVAAKLQDAEGMAADRVLYEKWW